jgi:hypothetical protein
VAELKLRRCCRRADTPTDMSPELHFVANYAFAAICLWALRYFASLRQYVRNATFVVILIAAVLLPGLPFGVIVLIMAWRGLRAVGRLVTRRPSAPLATNGLAPLQTID